MKKFLMCSPKNFNVNYEINPWMKNKTGSVDLSNAEKQWDILYHKIKLKSEIKLMENQPIDLPDLVFTANAGLMLNENFILANFEKEERKNESLIYKNFLENNNVKVDTFFCDNDISFEGAGDALLDKRTRNLVLAYGFRTNKKAFDYLDEKLRKNNIVEDILHVELVNPNFYHLDTCFCPLDNGYILFYPGAFSAMGNKLLLEKFGNYLIAVSKDEANAFACNAVSLGSTVITNYLDKNTINLLNGFGLKVDLVELTEFMKSGGSAKCLTLEIY